MRAFIFYISAMKIYHNPRCTKSRQTLELIRKAGKDPEVIEYLKDPPTTAELETIILKLGIKPAELLRKNETFFKENYRGKSLSDKEWIKIMTENPILIERPIVVEGNKAVIGRPPENVFNILKP